jgi:hypothetical protein
MPPALMVKNKAQIRRSGERRALLCKAVSRSRAKKVSAMSRPTRRQFTHGAVKLMMAMSAMSAARAVPAQKRATPGKRRAQSRSMRPKKTVPAFQSDTPARVKSWNKAQPSVRQRAVPPEGVTQRQKLSPIRQRRKGTAGKGRCDLMATPYSDSIL